MKNVLLVEDDVNMGLLVTLALEQTAAVEHVTDGAAAVERLGREPRPDAVVHDVGLPKLTGHEVLARMRGQAATAAIPVLMLTAHDRERAARDGSEQPDAYLCKPFDIGELAAVVAGLLDGGGA